MARISGGSGDDNLAGDQFGSLNGGFPEDDQILGRAGKDTLQGFAGDNFLDGGIGDDFLVGGVGNDTLIGGDGNDLMQGGEGNDILNGDAGDDRMAGEEGNDILNGGLGNDFILGNEGNDILNGGDGNDTLNGGAGTDTLSGGDGDDLYIINSAQDVIEEDFSGGFDTVQSPVTYTLGDHVEALTLIGSSPIKGTGNELDNTITGNEKRNTLTGNEGDDLLIGGEGNDRLLGGDDNDTLVGGLGKDTLTGGDGNDRFQFNAPEEGPDTISDFNSTDDVIQVSANRPGVFGGFGGGLVIGSAISAAQFQLGTAALDSSDRFIYNKANGQLFFDADGTGVRGQILIATLSNTPTITAADIVVI